MPMNIDQQVALMREKGFVFDDHYKIRGIMANDADIERLAYDAAMVTKPNSSGVPVEFTSYLDPRVIEILTGPRNSREIFAEVKKGDWTTSYARFEVDQITGAVEAYTDYGNAGMADVNPTYPVRQQYVFQTNIRYGDRELDYAAKARLQLAARKQRAAATTIDIAQNKYNLLGVKNMEIYGLLNEPNRPAAITPGTGEGGNTWEVKTTKEIYADYLLLFQNLAKNSLGHIRNDSDLILVTSPSAAVELGKATDFNVSVMDMIKRYTPNIKFAQLPELENFTSSTVLLICRSINGEPTGEFGFSEKMRAMRLVPETSSFKQKFVGTSYGCILYRPFAVATMTGV